MRNCLNLALQISEKNVALALFIEKIMKANM